jgi:hypothetical protein
MWLKEKEMSQLSKSFEVKKVTIRELTKNEIVQRGGQQATTNCSIYVCTSTLPYSCLCAAPA